MQGGRGFNEISHYKELANKNETGRIEVEEKKGGDLYLKVARSGAADWTGCTAARSRQSTAPVGR